MRIHLLPILLITMIFCPAESWSAVGQTSGQVAVFAASMPSQDVEDVNQNSAGLELKIGTNYTFNKNLKFLFSPWFKTDPINLSSEERFQFDPDELAVEWRQTTQRLKLGYSLRKWEGTDLVNPMDVIHPKNWRDPLQGRLRPSPGLFYTGDKGRWSWDFTYIPIQSKALLPGEKSPWWPRLRQVPVEADDLILRLPTDVEYEVGDVEELDHALTHNFALRVQYHASFWDFSLAGFEGSSSAPLLTPVINLVPIQISPKRIFQLLSPIRIEPIHYRHRVLAFANVWNLDEIIIRLSAHHAQSIGDDPRLPGWSELGVIGVEKGFSFGNQSVVLLLQYIISRRPDIDSLSMLSSLFENSYMLGARWVPGEKWIWTAAYFQEQTTFSSLIHSELDWNFTENWHQKISVDLFSGSSGSPLGVYENNDQISLQTSYSF